MRKRLVVLLAVLLLMGSLACSASGSVEVEGPEVTIAVGGDETTEEAVAPTEPAAATEEATAEAPAPTEAASPPTEAPAPTEQPTVAPPPPPPPADQDPLEAADIPELQVLTLDPHGEGLGNLATFRQRMTVNFVAQDTDYSGTYNYEAEVNTADQAVHITLTAEGAAAQELPSNQVQAIWIGTRLWLKVGNQPWVPVPESVAELQFDEQMMSVGEFLPYVEHFDRVGEETVNGVQTVHYTYNSTNIPSQYGAIDGHGDVYVAVDGGYVVRYTLDGSGTFEQNFQGSGTISLVYDTYDVGAAISIQPPRR